MTLSNFIQGFFADRFFGSMALATVVFMLWLAWISLREYVSRRLQRQRYLRRAERFFNA